MPSKTRPIRRAKKAGPSRSDQAVPDAQAIDYAALCRAAGKVEGNALAAFLEENLPYACREAYLAASGRPAELVRIVCGNFQYVFDAYTDLEDRGEVAYSPEEDDRVVLAFGRSAPSAERPRDDYRLKGWMGPTERTLGGVWDKGHFIAHSLGGAVDRAEVNVFAQRRDLNRGWSAQGKKFRAMEEHCRGCPETFFFSRPIYLDGTCRPAFLEFGLLKADGTLWVERFDNRGRLLRPIWSKRSRTRRERRSQVRPRTGPAPNSQA